MKTIEIATPIEILSFDELNEYIEKCKSGVAISAFLIEYKSKFGYLFYFSFIVIKYEIDYYETQQKKFTKEYL